MKKEIRLEFAQSLEEIFAAYTDADFVKRKAEALGARHVEVHISKTDAGTQVVIEKEVPAEVPAFLQAFAGAYNKMTQTELWTKNDDGTATGQMQIDIPNAPIKIKSQMFLQQTEDGCTAETVTEVSNSIPFLGRKVNAFLLETAEKNIEKEFWFMAGEV